MNVEDLDAALDIPDESDSEDFCHSGNGTPCKYYNSKGCRNGTRCRYSHAPDAKSVRDELYVVPSSNPHNAQPFTY